jgi:hypothetical protein
MLACQSYAHPLLISICDDTSRRLELHTIFFDTNFFGLPSRVNSPVILAEPHVEYHIPTRLNVIPYRSHNLIVGNCREKISSSEDPIYVRPSLGRTTTFIRTSRFLNHICRIDSYESILHSHMRRVNYGMMF